MDFKLTNEEIEAIKLYKNEKHIAINQQLMVDAETDIDVISSGNSVEYSKNTVIENIEIIKRIYEAMVKAYFSNTKSAWRFFRGTNIAEIERLKNSPEINKFLLTSDDPNAKMQSSNNWGRPVIIEISGAEDIPYINLNDVLNDGINEILIAPFTEIVNIEEQEEFLGDTIKNYKISLRNQDLINIDDYEKQHLYDNILTKADNVNERLKACIELEEENLVHYENIRKLEQLLAKHNFAMEQEGYDIDLTDAEKQADLDDIARINLELDVLKDTATKVFEIRKENIEYIQNWKKDVIKYLKAECQKIKESFEAQEIPEIQEPEIEEVFIEEKQEEVEEIKTFDDPIADSVKSECTENIEMVKTLLNNIKQLISKQQNHARIAESIDSNYKALNNAFEMRNYAEELENLVNAISSKVDIVYENKEELEKISRTNLQISTLINYLNNAKSAVGKRISRFDEINIIEENELKREIAETIKNIRCEAELRKLRDDIEIIEEKTTFQRFLGKLTGRNKLDETMLDQIQVRQTAIKKTFKNKMPLAYNYSIHALIAEIEMFIKENQDDELVIEEVSALRKIEETLKKNFVIIDSKVVSIIDQKTGKNLPLASGKISKKELIEIDTYRFLNRYGYDKATVNNEPEYQDTMANEIKRIVDYIKSSGIL